MEKVKLPREVAEAIERLGQRFSRKNILAILLKGHLTGDVYAGEYQKEVSILRSMEFDDILLALANGYDIEPEPITVTITPEMQEKVKKYFAYKEAECKEAEKEGLTGTVRQIGSEVYGARYILKVLGITIPGVNA